MGDYQKHWLTPGEPFYEEAIEQIGFALDKGHSLITIKRIFGMTKVKFLYDRARSEGLISNKRQQRVNNADIYPKFSETLDSVGIGFQRWCNARVPALDVAAAHSALKKPFNEDDVWSVKAHKALSTDFPAIYQQIFNEVLPTEPLYAQQREPKKLLTLIIKPNAEEYVATTKEHGDKYKASHRSPERALKMLLNMLGIINGINKLKLLRNCNLLNQGG